MDVVNEEGYRYPQPELKQPEIFVSNAVRRVNEDDIPTLRMEMESDEATEWKATMN